MIFPKASERIHARYMILAYFFWNIGPHLGTKSEREPLRLRNLNQIDSQYLTHRMPSSIAVQFDSV